MRSYEIRVSPLLRTGVFIRGKSGQRETHTGETSCEDAGTDLSAVAATQEYQGVPGTTEAGREALNRFSLRAS